MVTDLVEFNGVNVVVPVAVYQSTSDANVLTGSSDVFSYMKANGYQRVFGQYTTTQSGLFPNNIYAGAAAMGIAMGLNTGLAGSYFTMWGKAGNRHLARTSHGCATHSHQRKLFSWRL